MRLFPGYAEVVRQSVERTQQGRANLSLESSQLRRDDIAGGWATMLIIAEVAEHGPPCASARIVRRDDVQATISGMNLNEEERENVARESEANRRNT